MKREPKKLKNMSIEAINGRVTEMLELRKEFMQDIDNVHVKLQKGNSKTGNNCWTVSLIPIADCGENCKYCKKDCYDIKNVCFQTRVKADRARNSAIHKADPERFWNEIDFGIKYECVTELRLNVGGDLSDKDFKYVAELGKRNPKCSILFFTKNYSGINKFLDNGNFPENVHPIMSAWEGLTMENPHSLPTAHVLYVDGRTTAPEFGAYYCKGNCSTCNYSVEGCWTLKHGESVIFPAH